MHLAVLVFIPSDQLCVRLLPYLAQLFVGLYLLYLSLFFEVKPALEAHFVLWTLVQGITNTALFGSLVTLKFSQYCCACESDEEGGYGIEVPPSDFANCSSILYFLLNCTLGCCGGLWMLAWLVCRLLRLCMVAALYSGS